MATAKQKLWSLCEELGIEIEHTCERGAHHVHVYAPSGKTFSGHPGLDNLSLADTDDGAPVWAECLRELLDALPLEDAPGRGRRQRQRRPGRSVRMPPRDENS